MSRKSLSPRLSVLALGLLAAVSPVAADPGGAADPGAGGAGDNPTVLNLPMRSGGPKSMDPVFGSTVYDNKAAAQVYETLLQYKYLVRPQEYEPLLLAELPKLSADGLTYSFRLKEGVHFHDDPCFPGGKGRHITSEDVFYSWKRMADLSNKPKSWWLFDQKIVGFDQYRAEQNAAAEDGGKFDYDAPVEGFRVINDREFEVVLLKKVFGFRWTLTMFQTSIVAREAVETYGTRIARHPVGTGPFTMAEADWTATKMVFNRNPNYHECYYPTEWMPEDVEAGFTEAAGQRLPIADRLVMPFYPQDQPMWLKFREGGLDFTQVPAENFREAINRRKGTLKPAYADEGITYHPVPLLDFIFRGFNMEDPLLGGYTDEKRYLRQAISLAIDWEEFNDSFYNNENVIYDGAVPPGLDGHPPEGRMEGAHRGKQLERAKELLAKAGYPDGKGLPVINYYSSNNANGTEQSQLTTRQLAAIGIKLNPRLSEFASVIEALNTKKAPMFSYAWSSDYPDGENNLSLFYGPNESPGNNHFNYKNEEYDRLYEQIQEMDPSPERSAIFERMQEILAYDTPFAGAMARTRKYLVNPWLKNFKPSEDFYNWAKYLDLDESKHK